MTNPLYTPDLRPFHLVPALPVHSTPRMVITLGQHLQSNLGPQPTPVDLPPEITRITHLRTMPRCKQASAVLTLRHVLKGAIRLPPAAIVTPEGPEISLDCQILITRPRPPLPHQPFGARQQHTRLYPLSVIPSTLGRRASLLRTMKSLPIVGMGCSVFVGELRGVRSGLGTML